MKAAHEIDPMHQYSLAEHVFLCVNDGHVVLLDVKQDRYWALEAAQTRPLQRVVPGWPVTWAAAAEATGGVGAAAREELEEAHQFAATLVEKGILCRGGLAGKDATPPRAVQPAGDLLTQGCLRHARIGAGATLNFIGAALTAKVALRRRFATVISEARERKRRLSRAAGPSDEAVRDLVAIFLRLRIFLFSSRNECLFDSLALLGFLARNGVGADWMFGVQARPFAAHCWVQRGAVILNDTMEHVAAFTPIMTV